MPGRQVLSRIVPGIIFCISIRKKYINGKWKGVGVYEILQTKMKEEQASVFSSESEK